MSAESPLAGNLEALRHTLPETAQCVASAAIPDGFERTPGTDGTLTFARISNAAPAENPSGAALPRFSRRIEWLGETSMPRAAARAIISGLDAFSNGANGLGLCIGSGFQWRAFIERLAPSQMLYVFEPDPGRLRMALEICDLADLLGQRRLVILPPPADNAAQALGAFLEANPGFEPPTVLHPPPALAGQRKNEMLSVGEAIVRRAVVFRQQQLAQMHEKIIAALQQFPGTPPIRPLAFLLSPRHPLEHPIIAAACNAGCTEKQTAYIDRHFSASQLLRFRMLFEALSDGLKKRKTSPAESPHSAGKIFSDVFRDQLASVPPAIPVETWVPPLAGAGFWQRVPPAATMSPGDRVMVHADYHAQMARMCGIKPEQIVLRPLLPAAPPPEKAASPAFALRHRVALIADLPKMDANSLGIILPTHVSVFAAAREMVAADFLNAHPGMAPDILRRALLRTGVDPHTEDPALQEPMLRMIRDVLIPSLPLVVLAEKLLEQQIALLLVGDWAGEEVRLAARAKNPSALRHDRFESYSPETWQDAAVLAHLSPAGVLTPFFWEAVESGVAVMAPEHPTDQRDGALAQILKPGADFAQAPPGQFFPAIKGLLKDAHRRQKLTASAAQTLQCLRS